ncbi:antibiotic biosynthesis monooxygenase family protein [Paenibacillus mendelii]|uniref:Antibiotic biosynthesis monooxygenase family protein n=1 Tax=Paenibacillus mendelii TaxID=206163 RepID=A0ABV6JBW6_9BACL|nr:antibiotic biosynthesis monooxygenase [Paenibacillus mendelii]MCQ6562914.1 antibiotic biosynthesis monooxygenase [Paenibacillus mendelii]
MIMELAILQVKPELDHTFIEQFKEASELIASMEGYIRHELQRCIEREHQYVLLVWWETLEDHVSGFRQSAEYGQWKRLLHHYYEPFPIVEHYEQIPLAVNNPAT